MRIPVRFRQARTGCLVFLLAATPAMSAPARSTTAGAADGAAAWAADGAAAGDRVLATVQGATVSRQEVEQAAAAALRPLQRKLDQLLESSLRALIDERLLDLESKRLGISRAGLLAREVDAKVAAPSEAEVAAYYEQKKSQLNGRTLEQAAPQIRQTLRERRRAEAREALLAPLRVRYEVRDLLAERLAAAEVAEARTLRAVLETPGPPARGPRAAPVKIVEFSDFECPFCSRLEPTLAQIEKSYGDRVQVIYRQFPLPFHAHSHQAAAASLCAADQSRFWEMHDLLFAAQKKLEPADLEERAAKLGLDATAFRACLESDRHAADIQADLEAGRRAGVSGTPALFVNGRMLSGAVPFEQVAGAVERELAASGAAGGGIKPAGR